MMFSIMAKDQYIIQVHRTAQRLWPKGVTTALLWYVFWMQSYLSITCFQVYQREHCGVPKLIQQVINARDGVALLLTDFIKQR